MTISTVGRCLVEGAVDLGFSYNDSHLVNRVNLTTTSRYFDVADFVSPLPLKNQAQVVRGTWGCIA